MVKHQRRSHQRGIHSSETDEVDSSDSDIGDSPPTPQCSNYLQWSHGLPISQATVPHNLPVVNPALNRSQSYGDFHQLDSFPVGQAYRQNFVPNQFHSLSEAEHAMINRTSSISSSAGYYVPEQNNSGMAMLNNTPSSIQTFVPRQPIDTKEGILLSSPSTSSPNSRASPDGFYSHQSHQPNYSLHNSSPMDQPSIMHYQPLPQLPSQPTQSMENPMPHSTHVQAQFHSPAPHQGSWYEDTQYSQPGLIGVYPDTNFHPFLDKIESYEDQAFQLPSARIDTIH